MPEYAWVVEERPRPPHENPDEGWRPRDIFTVFAAAEGRLEQLRQSAMGASISASGAGNLPPVEAPSGTPAGLAAARTPLPGRDRGGAMIHLPLTIRLKWFRLKSWLREQIRVQH
jgi:hypothetical protein